MNAFQARMFIEQILAQPTVPAAAQLVQANVRALDQTFFLVLGELIQAEQSPPVGSWGSSYEDRMAEMMARINSPPPPPSQRLQALQMLHDYALQVCHQQLMAQTAPAADAARGFDHWAQELRSSAVPPRLDPPAPATGEPSDLEKGQRLMAIDRRYLPLMPQIMPGRASLQTIAELETILADYEQLARVNPPTYPLYTAKDLSGKIADVLESIARSHDSLNHAAEAREHYRRASERWTEAEKPENAQRCGAAMARLNFATEGNVDAELQRLQSLLATTAPDSLAHVQVLVELGELQSNAGDDFAAEELLLQARDELGRLGYGLTNGSSGIDLARALEQSMRGILSGQAKPGATPIEAQMQARGLQRRILLALAQICRDSDPTKASEYLQQAKQMESADENQVFTDQMLASLGALFGGPSQPPRTR